jgi:hypothetical protein
VYSRSPIPFDRERGSFVGIMNRASVDRDLRRDLGLEMYPVAKRGSRAETPAFDLSKQLWPKRLPVIGGSGRYESGKTLFGLSISPGPSTICYDFEDSSAPYEAIGFERVDVPRLMQARRAGSYNPLDTFVWFWDQMKALVPGKHRVIVVDPITDIESGAVQWVKQRPQDFGYTPAQFSRMEGIMWDCMKQLWKAILLDISTKVETFYFVAHGKREWIGSTPTTKEVPKGKQTLMELASLYLWFDRSPNKDGEKPAKPAANVLKQRIIDFSMAEGVLEIAPILPPRLPEATPQAIREYMLHPANYDKLKPEERYVERAAGQDEILAMQQNIAETELKTESLRTDRMSLLARHAPPQQAAAEINQQANQEFRAEAEQTPVAAETPVEGMTVAAEPAAPTSNKERVDASLRPSLQVTEFDGVAHMHGKIIEFLDRLQASDSDRIKICQKRGVEGIQQLDRTQAFELFKALASRVEDKEGWNPGK